MSSDKNIEERFEQMADEIAALKVELANANELISTLRAEIAQNKSKYEQQNCVICLNSLCVSKICYLPCLHEFHCDCMDSWANVSIRCPICRQPWKKVSD